MGIIRFIVWRSSCGKLAPCARQRLPAVTDVPNIAMRSGRDASCASSRRAKQRLAGSAAVGAAASSSAGVSAMSAGAAASGGSCGGSQ